MARLDYILISRSHQQHIKASGIIENTHGSDHRPIWVQLDYETQEQKEIKAKREVEVALVAAQTIENVATKTKKGMLDMAKSGVLTRLAAARLTNQL